MLQDVLDEPEWADLLTPADRRGLTPLFWSHVRPDGEVNLDMAARLNLPAATVTRPATHRTAITERVRGTGRTRRSSDPTVCVFAPARRDQCGCSG